MKFLGKALFVLQLIMQSFQGHVTEEEACAVEEIMETLAETHILRFSAKKSRMVEVGKKIEHLHPLDFLYAVLSSSRLRQHMKRVEKSGPKWRVFVNGLSRGLQRAQQKATFPEELERFLRSLKIENSSFIELVEQKKWESFLKKLFRDVELKNHLGIGESLLYGDDHRFFCLEIGLERLVKKLG